MITEMDIIRLLSDPRFERTVLAIVRKKLSNYHEEEHVAESDRELPAEWGWIPIAKAASKYGIAAVDIDAAIQAKHVLGNGTKVDESSLRVFIYGKRKKRGLPPLETEEPEDLQQDTPALAKEVGPLHPTEPSYTMPEAAALLNVSEERLTEHILAGTLRSVGEDGVSKASVHKQREHLVLMGLVGPMPEPTHARDTNVETTPPVHQRKPRANARQRYALDPDYQGETMGVAEAAVVLGITMSNASALASTGVIQKVRRGVVTKASVEAYQLVRKPRATKQSA